LIHQPELIVRPRSAAGSNLHFNLTNSFHAPSWKSTFGYATACWQHQAQHKIGTTYVLGYCANLGCFS
jgi:hypothetical protein